MQPYFAFCLSGGLDSTTLLALTAERWRESRQNALAVTFKYPSKHNSLERAAAQSVASFYGIDLLEIDMTHLFGHSKSSLIDADTPIPEGHYELDTMKSTVVPMRNVVFVATAAAAIMQRMPNDADVELFIGVHAGDHHIYPDCRPSTILPLQDCVASASDGVMRLSAPFLNYSKSSIVEVGIDLSAPYHLTRTCYTSDERACGKCGSCIERLEAFAAAGYTDPVKYQL